MSKICPRCHKKYDEYPAISRRDNKTQICSVCGTDEAMFDFMLFKNKDKYSEEEITQQRIKERTWLDTLNK